MRATPGIVTAAGLRGTVIAAAVPAGFAAAGACWAIRPEAGAPALAALAFALPWWLAVLAIVHADLDRFIIPDEAAAAVALLGLAQASALPLAGGEGVAAAALAAAGALGTGAGAFLLFWVLGALSRRLLGRDALGFGDVKLAGASALWLAPADAALALEIAALGALGALLVARRRGRAVRETAVPFGAFLAPAAWLVFVAEPAARRLLG